MNNNSLRAEVYSLLSEAFKKPTEEFIAEQKAIVDFLKQAFDNLGYSIDSALYSNWPNLAHDLPSMERAYQTSFVFPVPLRVLPVESIYRRWTNDPTAELPFAAEKGMLMSDHALHMVTLYDAYGLSIPEEYRAMPDHLCLELEFAAFLLENEDVECFSLFLQEHLNWLDELAHEAVGKQIPEYYLRLIRLTAQFLSEELRRNSLPKA